MPTSSFDKRAEEWARRSIPLHLFEKRDRPWLADQSAGDRYLEEADRCFASMMANCFLNKYLEELSWPLEQMQSPIERLFALALTLVGSLDADVVYQVAGRRFGAMNVHRTRSQRLVVEPQAQIRRHHVDFLITLEVTQPEYQTTQRKAGTRTITQSIIVECDGHDFHEKTKEQARRDKRRDREVQDYGSPVFRFTGSEVYADPFACASQVVRKLQHQMMRQGPQHGVTVAAFKAEMQAFLEANGGLGDTWFFEREQIVERHGDIWQGFRFEIASEGAFFGIMNLQGGCVEEPELVQANFDDLIRSLGWCYEANTHFEWLFYPIEMIE